MGNRAHNLLRCSNPIHCGRTAGSLTRDGQTPLIALNFHITLSYRLQPRTVLHNDVTFYSFFTSFYYYLCLMSYIKNSKHTLLLYPLKTKHIFRCVFHTNH